MKTPAIIIAGTGSGGGKTTLTLGLLAALGARGLTVQSFKCGPDFIDPTLHRAVTGRRSPNLDLRMCGADYVRALFHRHAADADIAVIEGVMGLFDGGAGSAAALAHCLDVPVVLVVDARSQAESAAAVVKGFTELDPGVRFAGVICNRVGSGRHEELLRAAIGRHCPVPVLGCLGRDPAFEIPSRHLGLHMGQESPLPPAAIDRLAAAVGAAIDLDALLRQPPPAFSPPSTAPAPAPAGPPVRIAVARDTAFCFYYEENLEILSAHGAEIVPFSPLADAALPAGTHGVYLGGGYPELHARELAANAPMRAAINAWAAAGGPLYAECGGLMYLTRELTTDDGVHPMCGVFAATSRMGRRLAALGYREAEIVAPCLFGDHGRLHGHEFHYSEVDGMASHATPCYRLDNGRREGYGRNRVLASYVHLHFGRTPWAAAALVNACRQETP